MTLQQLQQEVAEWSARNFPNKKPHQPLLGVSEECGELCHAHLKGEQEIRHSFEEIGAMKADAVGDIIVYLADYCEQNKMSLAACVEAAWGQVKQRDWIKNNKTGQ